MINPFFVSSFTLLLVLGFHQLKWSNLYTVLSFNSILFIVLLIISNLFFALVFKKYFKYKVIPFKNINLKVWIIPLIILYIINFLYSGEVPLINLIFNIGTYYKDIEMIPTLFPLLMSINVFLIIYSFSIFNQTKKRKYLKYTLLLLVPIILNNGRGVLVMAVLPCALIYFSSLKLRFLRKHFHVFILGSIFASFVFGYIGNSRMDTRNDILAIGHANQEFLNYGIPSEFFWTYLYVVSPISNFDNFILNDSKPSSFFEYFVYNFLPQSLNKSLIDTEEIDRKDFLVIDTFNVSTTYGLAFVMQGWLGVFFYILIYNFFLIFSYFLTKGTPYELILLSLFSMISALSLFSNILVLDVVFIPILITLLLSFNRKFIKKLTFL
jgi:oligosaccharide repeat unit polymerase